MYVDASGTRLSGGWDWGCSHKEGIALWPVSSGDFASLCGDDWRSAAKNPADSSGPGWTVTSKWATHQIAVSFLRDASTPDGP